MDIGSRVSRNTIAGFGSDAGRQLIKFIASIVFANVAGSAALGTLYLFMSLFRVGRRITTLGMGQAVVTRVSGAVSRESHSDIGAIVASSLLIRLAVLLPLTVASVLAADQVDSYVGFNGTWIYLPVSLGAVIIFSTVRSILSGFKRVDLSSGLDFVRDLSVAGIQIGLVLLGLREFGLIIGFVVGLLGATLIAIFVSPELRGKFIPDFEEVRSLVSFARFAYLDSLIGGEQIWLDVLILGIFVGAGVTQSDIGIYGIAYSLSMLGLSLSATIGRAILPEISSMRASNHKEENRIIEKSLRYATLFSIPMAFGAAAVGDLLLRDIYSFRTGYTALVVLTTGGVGFSVYQPIHQVFYGRDRPSYAFAVSLVTTGLNAFLNLALIPVIGVLGAAISTAFSMWLALVFGLLLLYRLDIRVDLPIRGWAGQISLAVLMAGTVVLLSRILQLRSRALTIGLVSFGALLYMALILLVDNSFRERALGMVRF